MALRDAVQLAATTHTYVDIYTGNATAEQAGAYEIDGDFDTWHGVTTNQGGAYGSCSATVSGTHTFANAITLYRVTYRVYAESSGASSASRVRYVAYKVGSTWTDVPSSRSIDTDDDSGETTYDFATPIENVTDIMIYSYALAVNDAEGVATADSKIYEIQAYYRIKKSYSGVV